MFDPDMPEPHVIESLMGFVDKAEKAIESAKALGYIGVSIDLSLETALNLVKFAKRYQEALGYMGVSIELPLETALALNLVKAAKCDKEPTFLGFPKCLVEAFIENEAEAELPAEVVKLYRDYMTADYDGWETKEEFFIDEAFDVHK
ncbi:TPA: hypothetical protein QDZ84_003447 [Shewanella algae]|uniref:hypothetical protein n=1 Tax=Shewanella algae TaxID=38313 RepID=UPI001C58EE3C|nr:hypothetical protein [Shewanella algae]HDS1208408.1 hypothetical protein [Shewanella algae]